jgi:hypothetical protein
MRYRLRTLLIVLAVGPAMIWAVWLALGPVIAAAQRSSAEDWIRLLLVVIAIVVIARSVPRRSLSRG